MKKIENVLYGDGKAAQVLDIYLPDRPVTAVFVYFHGGGLEGGDKSTASIFAPYLTERGISVISANYRMYPEAKYPDYILDAAAAVAWTKRYMHDKLNCNRFYVGGSSAGAYLSMMLCFNEHYLNKAGVCSSDISGYFHDAGQPTTHYKLLEQSCIDPRRVVIDERAPLYYVGLQNKYPSMHFVVSDHDLPNRYEQTMLMIKTLSQFEYKDFDFTVMSGGHCEYCEKLDCNGESILGKLIYSFIEKTT